MDSRSYQIGIKTKAYVGEELLTRKAYKTLVQSNAYQAKQAFVLSGGLASVALRLSGKAGDAYEIAGTNEKGNDIVMIPGSHLLFGIDKAGYWDQTVVSVISGLLLLEAALNTPLNQAMCNLKTRDKHTTF